MSDAPYCILIGKPGLDGHDRGAKYVARVLSDAGFHVVYTGIRRTPEQIVDAALEHRVDAVGLSLLSGAHEPLFTRVLELLEERRATHILVFGGGVIPDDDAEQLLSRGVRAIFTPGTPGEEIVATVRRLLAASHDERTTPAVTAPAAR